MTINRSSEMSEVLREAVFDIEADNLLEEITKIWMLAIHDQQTGGKEFYTDFSSTKYKAAGTLREGVKKLISYDKIIAHNIFGYDYHVLEMFFPSLWNRKTVPFKKCWDTYVQSKCQMFDRPRLKGVKGNHGLAYYGELFKYPKPPIEDWSYFDDDKINRCLVDIEINTRTYHYLNKEAVKIGVDFNTQIRRSQASAYWHTKQGITGITANTEDMKKSVAELDKILLDLETEIEPLLPKQVKVKSVKCTWEDIRDKWSNFFRRVPSVKYDADGKVIKDTYMPTTKVFLKDGTYDKHTAKWFGIEPDSSFGERMIGGVYTKIYFEESRMSQHAVVKDYLLSIGWRPTQFNYQKDKEGKFVRDDKGKMIPKSPKLTEDSFDSIKGELGRKIANFNTYTHRRRTFLNEKSDDKGWLNQIRPDGRLSAGVNVFNTSTGRGVQFGLVNCPSSSALYGANMRRPWEAAKGKVLVSVDQDSAQLRLLANYMGDPVYTDAVLNGCEYDEEHKYVGSDVHSRNGVAFGVLPEDLILEARETQKPELIKQCTDIRKYCKNTIYAFLFGAGDEKFAQTLKLKTASQGKAIKEQFTANLPAIGELLERLKKQYMENKYGRGGFIEVAGGTWLYCTSEHKLLNYLLMGSEAVVQNQASCWVNNEMQKLKLHGNQVLAFHDEMTFEFPEEEKQQGIILLSDMYGVASKQIGLEVLVTGTAQSGYNYLDIH